MSMEPFDQEETIYKKIRPYIVVSLLVHLLLLLLFEKIPGSVTPPTPSIEAPIWVDLKQQKYQIADIDKPAQEKRPDKSQFLGMYDSAVPEEQVAARQGREKTLQTGDQGQGGGDQKQKAEKQQAKKEEKQQQKTKETPLKDLYKFDKETFTTPEPQKSAPKTIAGGSPSSALPDDFYPDYKKGSRTYLNVLRYPDIQYFVLLKRVFKTTFDPIGALRAAFTNNQITRGSVETVLGVTLDAKGNLAELFVFKSSGISEYDQETLRTIRASAPFSTPPKKLLDAEGVIRMSWTFTVYL